LARGRVATPFFLAAEGYAVRATDISSLAVERLAQKAQDTGIRVETAVSDIAEEELKEDYDAIVCTVVLHHLTEEDAELVIRKMQRHTKPRGFNLITTFTKEGDLSRSRPDTMNFYPSHKEQLEHLYASWKLIESFEKEARVRSVDAEGNPQFNVFAGLLAQKV
jgi:2-polyprenyl-3-methyl-5-hydroxy-6-metoxy-1,4-benzoquinol methylase